MNPNDKTITAEKKKKNPLQVKWNPGHRSRSIHSQAAIKHG